VASRTQRFKGTHLFTNQPGGTDSQWQLPTETRAVRAENQAALLRRWEIARVLDDTDPRIVSRWFPGQRDLLERLSVYTEDEVKAAADCLCPLFTIALLEGHPAPGSKPFATVDPYELANREEVFMALCVRLDAIRTDMEKGCILHDLTASEAGTLSSSTPHQLKDLAASPGMTLNLSASDQYFSAVLAGNMTVGERTRLAFMSKKGRANFR
jgi:hypothetical protein